MQRYVDDKGYNYHCEHEVLHIAVDVEDITEEDMKALRKLGVRDGEYGDGLQLNLSC